MSTERTAHPVSDGSRTERREQARALLERCAGEPVVIRRAVVPAAEVVYVKGIVEASRGLATMVADGIEVVFCASVERSAELDRLLSDLAAETGLRLRTARTAGLVSEGGHG